MPPQNRIRTGKNDKGSLFVIRPLCLGETMTITIVKAALTEDLQMMLEQSKYMEEIIITSAEMSLEIL